MPYLGGTQFTALGSMLTVNRGAGVPAEASILGGRAVDPLTSYIYIELLGAGIPVPAGAVIRNGLAFTSDGALYCTPDAPADPIFHGGVAVRIDGAVHVTEVTPTTPSYMGGRAYTTLGQLHIGAGVDAYLAFVKLLLGHTASAHDSVVFTDESASAHTVTPSDVNVKHTTAEFPPTVASSIVMPGGEWLSVASHADFGIGTGDFAIEAWGYWTSTFGDLVLLPSAGGGSGLAITMQNGDTLAYYANWSFQITYTPGGSLLDTWHRLAVARKDGVTRLFLNGTQIGSDYVDATDQGAANNVQIGNSVMAGYVADVRITIGSDRGYL